MGSISFSNPLLQSALGTALQSVGLTNNASSPSSVSSTAAQPDNSQVSPFAQLMSTLQQLQQSNPTKYAQVTQQIAANLQNAAQTATSSGNTAAASQLNQLATDFSNASQSGQLPNVMDVAQAMGGGGHHHHHHESTSGSSGGSGATSSASSGSGASQAMSQILAAFQSNTSQSASTASTNPMSIIMNTLSSAGITAPAA